MVINITLENVMLFLGYYKKTSCTFWEFVKKCSQKVLIWLQKLNTN